MKYFLHKIKFPEEREFVLIKYTYFQESGSKKRMYQQANYSRQKMLQNMYKTFTFIISKDYDAALYVLFRIGVLHTK